MSELVGVFPTIPTPFTPDEEIDEPALRELLDNLLSRGVDGFVPIGSMGEFAYLSESERLHVMEICIDQVGDRGKLIIGTSAQSTRDTIRYTKAAAEAGADGVMIAAPWYGYPTDLELERHYRDVAQAADIPIVPYNNPFTTGGNIPPYVLAKLAEHEPNIRHCKETTFDVSRIMQILELTDKLTVLCGTDNMLLLSYMAGAKGLMTATSAIAPEICVKIHQLATAKQWEEARVLNARILPLGNFMETGRFTAYSKAAMAMSGLKVGSCRRPILPLNEEEQKRLEEVMAPILQPAS